jgi:hypothetical protein
MRMGWSSEVESYMHMDKQTQTTHVPVGERGKRHALAPQPLREDLGGHHPPQGLIDNLWINVLGRSEVRCC